MRLKAVGLLALLLGAMILPGCGDTTTNPTPAADGGATATDAAAKMPPPTPPGKK